MIKCAIPFLQIHRIGSAVLCPYLQTILRNRSQTINIVYTYHVFSQDVYRIDKLIADDLGQINDSLEAAKLGKYL